MNCKTLEAMHRLPHCVQSTHARVQRPPGGGVGVAAAENVERPAALIARVDAALAAAGRRALLASKRGVRATPVLVLTKEMLLSVARQLALHSSGRATPTLLRPRSIKQKIVQPFPRVDAIQLSIMPLAAVRMWTRTGTFNDASSWPACTPGIAPARRTSAHAARPRLEQATSAVRCAPH